MAIEDEELSQLRDCFQPQLDQIGTFRPPELSVTSVPRLAKGRQILDGELVDVKLFHVYHFRIHFLCDDFRFA